MTNARLYQNIRTLFCFCRGYSELKEGKTDASCFFFFLLPRHKQDAGSYKDSIIKSTENN